MVTIGRNGQYVYGGGSVQIPPKPGQLPRQSGGATLLPRDNNPLPTAFQGQRPLTPSAIKPMPGAMPDGYDPTTPKPQPNLGSFTQQAAAAGAGGYGQNGKTALWNPNNPMEYYDGNANDFMRVAKAQQLNVPAQGFLTTPGGAASWGYGLNLVGGHTQPSWSTTNQGQPTTTGTGVYGGGGVGGGLGGFGGGTLRGPAAIRALTGTGGGGGIGGLLGGNSTAGQIGQQLQNDTNAANAANQQRYEQALQTSQQGTSAQQQALSTAYSSILGNIGSNKSEQQNFLSGILGQQQGILSGLGGTQHEQETRRLAQQEGGLNQQLVGQGLGNSTVLDSMKRGLESNSAFNQRAIDNALAQQQLGVLGQYGALGANVLSQTGTQGINAQQQQAGLQNSILGNGTAQQVALMEAKQDLPPPIGAYLQLLSQAGALGGAGAGGFGGAGLYGGGGVGPGGTGRIAPNQGIFSGGGGGGGNANDPASLLQQYIQSLMGGGNGNNSSSGANPYVDPRTVAANARIRQQQQGQLSGNGSPTQTWDPGMSGNIYGDSNYPGTTPQGGGMAPGDLSDPYGPEGDTGAIAPQPPQGYYGQQPYVGDDGQWYIQSADGSTYLWNGGSYQLAG